MKNIVSLTALPLVLFSSLGFTANYNMVVDAGSSGSRLYIYEYDTSTAVPAIKKVYSSEKLKDDKGLASYATKPAEVQNYLKPLFDGAQTFLNSQGIDKTATPINFLGTAGMRLVDKQAEQVIYHEVQNLIETSYGFPVASVKTISGEMEGLYGWMDINYLKNNFQNHSKPVGIIEMGGASTQIAYVTTDFQSPDVFSVDIDHIHYSVLSKSFLGFGQDQSLASMKKYEKSASCFPINYTDQDITKGAFDSQACNQIYTDMIDKKGIQQQLAPYPMDGNFIAYSGIYYTFNFFESDKALNQAAFEAKIKAVCNKEWSDLKNTYPTVDVKYLSTYCANGVYEDELLFNTYKLQDAQLTITNKVEGQSADWTLGAVLYDLVSPKAN